jgi:hypothetical protein
MGAKTAPLTGNWINCIILDGIKATQVLAQSTFGASVWVYMGYLTTPELGFFFYVRAE